MENVNLGAMASDSDDEGGNLPGNPLQILLHLAGAQVARARGGNNEELLRQMRAHGTITSDKVFRAMSSCPRGHFVPRRYREEAFNDMPIRVEAYGFNISAPHMHAAALEALEIQPGDRVLDVGCGCGVWTACAAYLAGPTGEVVGVDIREACVDMCESSELALRQSSPSYAAAACPVRFEHHDIFMPSHRHRGRYTKVHVGATCPEARLPQLMSLLAPEGGAILAPVGTDLRLVKRSLGGRISHKILSQVRFQDLEVPTDAQVVLATLQDEQQEAAQVRVPPSTLPQDLKSAGTLAASSSAGHSAGQSAGSSAPGALEPAGCEESDDTDMTEAAITTSAGCATPKCAKAGSSSPHGSPASGDIAPRDQGLGGAGLAVQGLGLGPPDAWLVGNGWRLAVHKALLCARCELLRAKWCSGMRDASDGEVQVPEAFSRASVQALVDYVYSDQLDEALTAERVMEVLQVAAYYGSGRLLVLCEAALAEELAALQEAAEEEEAAELAAVLLAAADELGLQQLRGAALAHCVQHFADVSASRAWRQLGAGQVALVAQAAVGQLERVKQLLGELSESSRTSLPSPRWF